MNGIIQKGIITQGKYKGWKVAVQDDRENTGGFLVLIQSGAEGYDDWVPDKESLGQYFQESGWEVSWEE